MKKTALLLAVLLLVLVTGCERRDQRPESSQEPEQVEESSVPEEPSIIEEESSEEEPEDEFDPEEVRQAVELALIALQSGSRKAIQPHVDYDALLKLQYEGQDDTNFRKLLQRMQFEIQNVEGAGDRATVSVRITNIDMNAVLGDYIREAMSMEYENALAEEPLDAEQMELQYQQMFESKLDQNSALTASEVVRVQLAHNGETWKIDLDSALQEAVLGGYFAAQRQVGETGQ